METRKKTAKVTLTILVFALFIMVCSGKVVGACPKPDLNGDGIVNFEDLSILASQWLAGTTPDCTCMLIGLYSFEDGTANNAVTNLPDLISSGCSFSNGNAILDSCSDYLELPAAMWTSFFTIWIDATYSMSNSHGSIVSQAMPTANQEDWDFNVVQFVIYDVSPNRVRTVFYGSAGEFNYIDSGIGLMDGSRRQIAVTWDGTNMGVFFDDVLKRTSVVGWPDIDASVVRFGASQHGSVASLGSIHEIRIYDRALSEEELVSLTSCE